MINDEGFEFIEMVCNGVLDNIIIKYLYICDKYILCRRFDIYVLLCFDSFCFDLYIKWCG